MDGWSVTASCTFASGVELSITVAAESSWPFHATSEAQERLADHVYEQGLDPSAIVRLYLEVQRPEAFPSDAS